MIGGPSIWLLFAAAAALSAALTAPVRHWLLHRRLLDVPEARRSHAAPTPRGGGLAIVGALVLAWLVWPGALSAWAQPMAAVLIMALIGWLDDRFALPVRWRFLAQLLVAAGLLAGVGGVHSIDLLQMRVDAVWLWTPLAVIAAVWLINLHNFMDGSDGMAAGQGLWFGLVAAVLFSRAGEPMLAAFAGAAAGAWGGFLVWNRPPAAIFMGDVGSLSLGAMIAACAVLGAASGTISIWLSFMAASLFVVDATATLVRRVARKERWYTAHRQHAYQRLLTLGWSHAQVLGLYLLVNIFVVLPAIAAAVRWPHLEFVLAAGLAVVLAVGWQVVQSAVTSK